MKKYIRRAATVRAAEIKPAWFEGDRLEHPPATETQTVYIQPQAERIAIKEADESFSIGRVGDFVVYTGGRYQILKKLAFEAIYEEVADPTPLEVLAAEVEQLRTAGKALQDRVEALEAALAGSTA